MLNLRWKSTGTLSATLTDDQGALVAGATVTVTIVDSSGAALATDAEMVDQLDGDYDYTVAYNLLPLPDRDYLAKVTAIKGSSRAYAEIDLSVAVART